MVGEVGGVETVGVPLQIDGARLGTSTGAAARSAAATRPRCCAELGYSETEIATLVAEGVVVSSA